MNLAKKSNSLRTVIFQIQWWRLQGCPAKINELLSVELSWAWKPTYREGARCISPGKRSPVLFIAETWMDEARLKDIKRNLEIDNVFVVPRNNSGVGLALFWKNSMDVNVETFSKNQIDSIINKGKEDAWRFTGFYGEPVTHLRHESWSKLRQLNSHFNLSWLCAGDFNEILRSNGKHGGSSRSQSQKQLFRDVVDECGSLDLEFVGP